MDFLQTDYAGKKNKLKLMYSQEALFHDIVGGGGGSRTRLTNANQIKTSVQSGSAVP